MKFICLAENLQSIINTGVKITPNNPSLPILGSILLSCNSKGMVCVSTNLEITLKLFVRGNSEIEGQVCVPAKAFQEICQVLPKDSVELELKNSSLIIKNGNYEINLNTLPTSDFPVLPDPENGTEIKFKAGVLKKMIERVSFAASVSESQIEISSVLLRNQNNYLICTATDRYRLAEIKIQENAEDFPDTLVSIKSTAEILRILALLDPKEEVGLNFSDSQLWLQTSLGLFIGRTIDGQYPDYEQIIPKSFKTVVKINKEDFLRAIKAAGVFSRDKGGVKLVFEDNKLMVSSQSGEKGSSQTTLPLDFVGDNFSISFGYKYLLDGIVSIQGNEINLGLVLETSPACFTSTDADGFSYVIMPLKGG